MQGTLISLLAILALVACAVIFMRSKLKNIADKKNLKNDINREVTKMTKGAPREAIMVGVYKQGTCYFKSEGHFSEDLFQLPDHNSVFQIGSLSKLITVNVLHSLIEEGLVSMDSTLGELLGDKYEIADTAQKVTLRQLVTHTSGFPRIPQAFFNKTVEHFGKDSVMVNPYSVLNFDDVISYLETCEGQKESGNFEYSNFGSGLLGHVLEVVSGKDLNDLAYERIFNPLGMTMTSTTLNAEMKESVVQGYTRDGGTAEHWKFGALAGAGGFYSTAADMLSFLKTYLDTSSNPQVPLNAEGGWMSAGKLEKLYGNNSMVWHNGQVGGYSSYAAIDPESDAIVVILSAKATDLTMPGIMLSRLARSQSWAASANH